MLAAALSSAGCGGTASPRPSTRPDASLFAYAQDQPLAASSAPAGADGPVDVATVSYASVGGVRVPALFGRVRDASARRGCLLFELGLDTRKEDAAFVFPEAAALGLSTLTIDLREQGERVTSAGAAAAGLADAGRLRSLVRGDVVDLRRAVDLLVGRPECRGRVFYVGHSLGGALGALLAGADDRIDAAVLISVSPTWKRAIQDTDFFVPAAKGNEGALATAVRTLAPLDPARWVGEISPRPVLVLNGDADPLVPPDAARAFAAAAGKPKTVQTYAGGHEPFEGTVGAGNSRRILAFLRPLIEG